ncbi:AAA family ATPase [Pseudoclavibacter sp. RFBB5]|uniref:AAA family ATPase n=1 Tax=Pseudoclavibacter sp. RFBB5 TaxID=2080574 RepID=UPI000CE86601|nr:AAA family ATPase [Pseudoclavibacter sp. RFBB5]PPG33152.1 hypothetical protein C5B97_00575 [Pseudoclavibacter sp. RFBB5]
MRIVVSGTHASGKSTLISDFAAAHPEYLVLPDPFEELIDDRFDELDAVLFSRQLDIAAHRLAELPAGSNVIAERGPVDFLAYLHALDALGRPGRSRAAIQRGTALTRQATEQIDLVALVPLAYRDQIAVGEDEDLELRDAMNDALLDLAAEPEFIGPRVVELAGDLAERLAQLEAATLRPSTCDQLP